MITIRSAIVPFESHGLRERPEADGREHAVQRAVGA